MAISPASLIRQNQTQNIAKTLRSDNAQPGLPPRLPPIQGITPPPGFTYADLMRSAGRTDAIKGNGPLGFSQAPLPGDTTPSPVGNWGNNGDQPAPGLGIGIQSEGMAPPGPEYPPFGEPDPLPGTGPGPSPTPNPIYNPPPGGVTIDPSIGSPAGPPMSGPHQDPYGLDPFGESGGANLNPDDWRGNANHPFIPNQGESIPGRLLRSLPLPYGANIPLQIYHSVAERIRRNQFNQQNQPQHHGPTSTRLGDYTGPSAPVPWYSRFYQPPEGIRNAIGRGDYPNAYGHTQEFLDHGLSLADQAFLAGPIKFGNRLMPPPPLAER